MIKTIQTRKQDQPREKNASAPRPTVARWGHILLVPVQCVLLGLSYLTLCPGPIPPPGTTRGS
jgi:hypothetical protein